MTNARRLQIAIPWLVGVGLFAVWELACRVFEIPPFVLPRPSAVFATMYDYRGPLLEHSLHTLFTTIIGFVLAVAGGTAIGLAVGASSFVYVGLYPVLIAFNSIPKVALVPVIVIWFGIEETAKVVLIYLACFAPLAMAARAGVRSVTIEQINAAYSMGASKWQVIYHVVIPAAMPEILTGMRIAIGFGWTTLVAAEMVAATAGLGQMVLNASNFLRTDVVIMGIVVIGAVAYLFDLLMRRIERKVVPWKGQG